MRDLGDQSSSPDPFTDDYANMERQLMSLDPDNMSEISYTHQPDQSAMEEPVKSNTLKGKEKCVDHHDSEFPRLNGFGEHISTEPFDFTPQLGSKRKGEPSKNGPTKKNPGRAGYLPIDMVEGPDECISIARDLLIKAAHQAESRSYQTKILDLLNIFRQFMEKDGNIQRETNLMTQQLQKLENTTQALQNTLKQPKTFAKIVEQGNNQGTTSTRNQQQPNNFFQTTPIVLFEIDLKSLRQALSIKVFISQFDWLMKELP